MFISTAAAICSFMTHFQRFCSLELEGARYLSSGQPPLHYSEQSDRDGERATENNVRLFLLLVHKVGSIQEGSLNETI